MSPRVCPCTLLGLSTPSTFALFPVLHESSGMLMHTLRYFYSLYLWGYSCEKKIPGSPHLHNFSVHVPECGSLGTMLHVSLSTADLSCMEQQLKLFTTVSMFPYLYSSWLIPTLLLSLFLPHSSSLCSPLPPPSFLLLPLPFFSFSLLPSPSISVSPSGTQTGCPPKIEMCTQPA